MTLKEFYQGKRILVTGTTGFLGKVLLQKILHSLPDVHTIYILIRSKKGSRLSERFKKEIVSSPCFDRIRKMYENHFEDFIDSKVKPIQGDLHRDGLGLSPEDRHQLEEHCQIIMNCAASIDFNAPLDQALQSNVKGTLRMMELAQSCKQLQVFTHVSTCYVNCNMRGLIREEIYESVGENPEELFQKLKSMNMRDLLANTKELLGNFPNTYTYTKSLCQKLIKRRKGNLPVCIVRPAIINTSYSQPFPGWLDSIAAAAAYFMFVGLGIVREVEAEPNIIGDTVPVDIVVANIVVASAFNAFSKSLNIYHVGSSDRNPLQWGQIQKIVLDFWNANPSQSRVSRANVVLSNNKARVRLSELQRAIPNWFYAKTAPYLGAQHVKNVQRLAKAEARAKEIKQIFHFFVSGEWIYQCRRMLEMQSWLTESDRSSFTLDCGEIDMNYFIVLNNYGIQKYILNENIELPTPENQNLLHIRSSKTYFSDIKWALSGGSPDISDKVKDKELRSKIIVSTRVLDAIEKQVLHRIENSSKNFEEEKRVVMKQANQIINELIGEFRMPVVRFLAWTLHKIFKRIYEKVNVNAEMFDTLREIEKNKKIPIVLLPTHRSYIDFLIVSYIFFLYQLKLPYIISDEALMNAYLIPFLIKSSGAFFFRPAKFQKSNIYKAIFNEYIQRLLVKGNNMEFFIEGSRSRTGKTQPAKAEILQIMIETVEKSMVSDLCLVPLTINYEKVLEGDTFPTELLGEEKVEESLLRVIKAIPLLKSNFGRVYVEISEPIFLNSYLKAKKLQAGSKMPKQIAEQLGNEIIYRLNQKLVIMSTGVVSAVLLMHRKGISEDMLIRSVNWISKYIVRKGYKIGGINENSSAFAVRNAINYLETITVKAKKSIFELQINVGNEFQKILMLSYYRNTITHAFLPEAFLGCAFMAFGEQLCQKEGVSANRLKEETLFLMQMLELEHLHPYNFEKTDQFSEMLKELVRHSIVKEIGPEKFVINKQQEKVVALYCSLLRPSIECYWAVAVYLIMIDSRENKCIELRAINEFYDELQWFIENFYEQKILDSYESCSLETIKNAINKYERMGFFQIKKPNKKEIQISVGAGVEKLGEIQSRLKNFLKNIYRSAVANPVELAKSTGVNIDYFSRL